MAYEVLMHSAPYAGNVVVFLKALPDGAVYFKTRDGSRQYILNLPASAARAHGGDVAMALRAMLINKNLKTTPAELNKAASAVISKNTIQHGYSFVYDDDDEESDYLEGHLQHHGILGMKWGVRRYQNADGSLTDAGRKHYGRNYTIHELKKNLQDPNLSYSEKKGLVAANKVNRVTKTPYRKAATSVATAATGLAGAGTLAGLMAAGVLSVNPLLPVAALAGGVVTGKAINAGRDILNTFRTLRVEMIDRELDKQKNETVSPKASSDKQKSEEKPHTYKPYGTDSETYKRRVTSMIEARVRNDMTAYNKIRNSFEADEDKDQAEFEADALYADIVEGLAAKDEAKKKK